MFPEDKQLQHAAVAPIYLQTVNPQQIPACITPRESAILSEL